MNFRSRIPFLFLGLFIVMFLFAPQADASKPIAKVSSFKGEVIILSDTKIVRVTIIGQILNEGDRIQTKQGEVEITFDDGAVIKVRPFTNTMIQEREEKSGFWIFKTKKAVRRITCFIGKLWFKSGVSKRKNYLQTPTAVCGVRGSEADIGYDNVSSYLNIYIGEVDIIGKVVKGFFADPGIDAATKNEVYQAFVKAHEKAEQAKVTGKAVDLAKARVETLQVIKVAATELQKNPDETVSKEAEVVSIATDAAIAAAEAEVVIEELKESKEVAEKALEEARAAGDEEAARKAEEQAEKAEEAIEKAEKAAEEAEKAAEEAMEAAEELDIDKVRDAAEKAKDAAEKAKDIGKEVIGVPPEVPAPAEPYEPSEEPGFEVPMEEEPPIQDTEPASPV